ncbi:MAG: alpha/beta hydrolase [Rhodospirillales bacterium 20-64-7]|nr:MAG: alpha/beta hydrolase [Rhodospirillales bacterium 20-64-7]
MPSVQSHVLRALLRLTVKRKLARSSDPLVARKVFDNAMPAPKGASFRAGEVGGIAGEWAQAGAPPAGTMYYLHGGGYFACSPRTHRSITGGFAVRGLSVFAPDYRLAPEHPFPAAVDDALAGYRGILASVAPEQLLIGGDSAGGGLALATLLAARDAGLPMPAAAILFSPWTDLAGTGASVKTNEKRDSMLFGPRLGEGAEIYLNGADATTPLASPLYGELAGLPPCFIQVGDEEILLDDSTRFAARARAAGVKAEVSVWPGLPHVWHVNQAFLPEARQALDQAAAFARGALASGGKAA